MTTKQRDYGRDTPLNHWIRSHPLLDSALGFVATDIDLCWYNHQMAFLMLIEQKEGRSVVGPSQEATLAILDQGLTWGLSDPQRKLVSKRLRIPERVYYTGLHTIHCERTSPLDGAVYIDDIKVSPQQLLQFLRFEWTPTIKVYLEQKQRLLQSRSLQDLRDAASFVASTTYTKHPEVPLLRSVYREKKDALVAKPMKQQVLKQQVNIRLSQIQQLQIESFVR